MSCHCCRVLASWLLYCSLSALVAAQDVGCLDADDSLGVYLVQTDRRAVKADAVSQRVWGLSEGGAQAFHAFEQASFPEFSDEKLKKFMPWLFRNFTSLHAASPRLLLAWAGFDLQTLPMESRADELTLVRGGLPQSSNWKIILGTPITFILVYLLVTTMKSRRTVRSPEAVEFDPSAIYIMCLIATMGGTMIVTLKPYIALSFGATSGMVGILQSAFSISQFFGTLYMGWLSDKIGRKRLLLVLPIGHTVAHLGCAMSETYWPFFFSRLLLGCFGGLVPISEALIAENVPKEECAGALGKLMAVLGLGTVAGPAMASLLAPLGFASIFYVAACFSIVLWAWLLWSFDDSWKGALPRAERTSFEEARMTNDAEKKVSPRYGMLTFWYFLVLFCVTSSMASMSMLPLIYLDWYGIRERTMGIMFMAAGFTGMAAQATLTSPVSKRFGELGTCTIGMFGGLCVWIIFLTFRSPIVPWIIIVLGTSLGALTDPTSCAAVAGLADDSNRGKLLGIYQALRALGQGMGPIIGGYLYEIGTTLPFRLSSAWNIIACVVCTGVLYAMRTRAGPEDVPEITPRKDDDGKAITNR